MADVLGILAVTLLLVCVTFVMHVRDGGRGRPPKARIREPRTRTIAYAVPDGTDPVVFQLGLERAGFIGEVARVGGARRLLVACKTTERAALRGVLEAVHARARGGGDLVLGSVVFEDER